MQFPEGLENTPFKLKVLNYSRNCSLHATLIPNLVKPLMYVLPGPPGSLWPPGSHTTSGPLGPPGLLGPLFPVDRFFGALVLGAGTRMVNLVSLFRSQTNYRTKVAWFQSLMFRWVGKVKISKQENLVFAKTLQNQTVKIVFSKLSVLQP